MYLASPRASPSWTSSTGRKNTRTAGRQSVVDVQGEDIAFTDLLRMVRKIYGYIVLFFFSLGFLCLIPPAEHLRGIR